MNKLVAATKANEEKIKGGDWRTFCPDGASTFRVKILPGGGHNDKFQKKAQELTKSYRRSGLGLDDIEPTLQKEIVAKLYATTIVSDWNAEDFGETFSPEACEKTILASPDFLAWLREESQDSASFRDREKKEISGNSQEPSDTI